MAHPEPLLPSLQQLVSHLALIDRNHYLADTDRRENDIEHSFSVALLCWFIHASYNIPLDIAKILKYALAHDFVERYAGDTNTFASSSERMLKLQREKESLTKLSEEFKGFPDMVQSMQTYENKGDKEVLFVWTVDKMQALILGDLDSWRPYKEIGVSYDAFIEKTSEQLASCSPYTKEIFQGLIAYSKTTYYDQPKHQLSINN